MSVARAWPAVRGKPKEWPAKLAHGPDGCFQGSICDKVTEEREPNMACLKKVPSCHSLRFLKS